MGEDQLMDDQSLKQWRILQSAYSELTFGNIFPVVRAGSSALRWMKERTPDNLRLTPFRFMEALVRETESLPYDCVQFSMERPYHPRIQKEDVLNFGSDGGAVKLNTEIRVFLNL